jgi:hypothetical protein
MQESAACDDRPLQLVEVVAQTLAVVRAGDGGCVVRNVPVVDGGVTAGGLFSGRCGGELVAVKLAEVVARHQ